MTLVQPSAGRATLVNTLNGVLITIPAKRNWAIILFLCAWLGGWFMGWVFVFGALFLRATPFPAKIFMGFWLTGWTVGGVFAMRTVVAMIWGKEVISVTPETLSISFPGKWFSRDRSYALSQVRRLRVEASDAGLWSGFFMRRRNPWTEKGVLRFDHGMASVNFAAGIEEPEARHLLKILQEKGLITNANLSDEHA